MNLNELYEAENGPSGETAELDPPAETEADAGPEHLDGFRAPTIEAEGGGEDDPVAVDPETGDVPSAAEAVELIGKGAFYTVFKTAFAAPAMFMGADWQPLAIQPHEDEIARDASDAIYEILEIYYPAALTPQSEGFARIMRAAPFIAAKVMIVRAILQARRAERLRPVNAPEAGPAFKSSRAHVNPANSNAPPADSPFAFADQEQEAAA